METYILKNKFNQGFLKLYFFLLAKETFHDLLVFSIDPCRLFLLVNIIKGAFHLGKRTVRGTAKFRLINFHLRLGDVGNAFLRPLPGECPLHRQLVLQLHL
jgi:hypothetical protein